MDDSRNFYRVQLGSNTPPRFTSDGITKPAAVTNSPYADTLASNAVDADAGDLLVFSKIDGPGWLSVAGDGQLTGMPAASDLGAGYFTVQVTDNQGSSAQAKLQITVGEESAPPPASVINTFNATDDTFAKQQSPDLDAGNRAALELRKDGASSFARVAYLKFIVTGVSNVMGAKLFLHSSSETNVVNALAVGDTSWTESSLNWTNRPPTGGVIGSGLAVPGAWFVIDVTHYVTTNGTYAIALDEQGNTYQDLHSKEGGYPPRLEVESAFE
jgi:hypothetical protein